MGPETLGYSGYPHSCLGKVTEKKKKKGLWQNVEPFQKQQNAFLEQEKDQAGAWAWSCPQCRARAAGLPPPQQVPTAVASPPWPSLAAAVLAPSLARRGVPGESHGNSYTKCQQNQQNNDFLMKTPGRQKGRRPDLPAIKQALKCFSVG